MKFSGLESLAPYGGQTSSSCGRLVAFGRDIYKIYYVYCVYSLTSVHWRRYVLCVFCVLTDLIFHAKKIDWCDGGGGRNCIL